MRSEDHISLNQNKQMIWLPHDQFAHREVHENFLGCMKRFETLLEAVQRIGSSARLHARGLFSHIPRFGRVKVIFRPRTNNICV